MNIYMFILLNTILSMGIILSFFYLKRLKNLIGYHLGMNISMTVSTVSALSFGGLWGYQFPHESGWVTIATTLAAMAIGMIFGTLVDYQTVVTGISSGIMAGLMAPMIVVHSPDPAIMLSFCILLFFIAIFMLCTSVKV